MSVYAKRIVQYYVAKWLLLISFVHAGQFVIVMSVR